MSFLTVDDPGDVIRLSNVLLGIALLALWLPYLTRRWQRLPTEVRQLGIFALLTGFSAAFATAEKIADQAPPAAGSWLVTVTLIFGVLPRLPSSWQHHLARVADWCADLVHAKTRPAERNLS